MNDYPTTQDLVACPYDPLHLIRPLKLHAHLIKCKKQHPSANLVTCMYNSLHLLKPADMNTHLTECPDNMGLEGNFRDQSAVQYVPKPSLSDLDIEFQDYLPEDIKKGVEEPSKTVFDNSKSDISDSFEQCYERLRLESELKPLPRPKSQLMKTRSSEVKSSLTQKESKKKIFSLGRGKLIESESNMFENISNSSHLLPDVSDMKEDLDLPCLPDKKKWNSLLDDQVSLFQSTISSPVSSVNGEVEIVTTANVPKPLGRGRGIGNKYETKPQKMVPDLPVSITSRGRAKRLQDLDLIIPKVGTVIADIDSKS